MIINHTHPSYRKKRAKQGYGKYNGAYYYSRDICNYIIPKVITDRHWVTIRLEEVPVPDHCIVFIHNNRNPNYYEYLKKVKDGLLICSTPHMYENMKFYGTPILLPLSVKVDSVKKYKVAEKTKEKAFAGRKLKINNQVPHDCDILTNMPQTQLIKEMSHYEKIYAVGRTAIQAKILGCKIGVYDNLYPDPNFWKILDCEEAAAILQRKLDIYDTTEL